MLKYIMQKIACVFSFKESFWVSCQKIVFNLHEAWSSVPNTKLLNFNYHQTSEKEDFRPLAHEIFAAQPDVIAIIDHRPHPLALFSQLLPLYTGMETKPKIIFHVFGDFTLNYNAWDKLQTFLKGFVVKFIVASPRQKLLIDKMLENDNSVVCPFPVNKKEFHFAPELRQEQRQVWGLKEDAVAFVFTGRLSRQKRIHTVISTFAEEFASESRAHLFIYGYADHIGDPFMGIHETENEYFRKFYRLYREFPEDIQARIHFMGAVANKELLPVYQAADFLVNLSVHNDEDYGMSVAEAKASGLPALLTDWGGLAGFEHPEMPEATTFVPVVIGERSKLISRTKVKAAFRKCFDNHCYVDRNKLSDLALKKFGLPASGEILNQVLTGPFNTFGSFGKLLIRISRAHLNYPHYPVYRTRMNEINGLYRTIYSAYVRKN